MFLAVLFYGEVHWAELALDLVRWGERMQLRFPGYGSVLPVSLGRQEYL